MTSWAWVVPFSMGHRMRLPAGWAPVPEAGAPILVSSASVRTRS
jgi:hypothetical protein